MSTKAEDMPVAEKVKTAEDPDGRFHFKLTVRGPNRFNVLYDGVLLAETEAEAADFLSGFRRLLMNGGAIPKSEPGPGEVSIQKAGAPGEG